MTRTILKNTLFETFSHQCLTLKLDQQFSSMLTEKITLNIENILCEHLGELTLKINLGKPKIQTLAQKETQANGEKIRAIQKRFLENEGVQKLQKIFNTRADINTIKEIDNV